MKRFYLFSVLAAAALLLALPRNAQSKPAVSYTGHYELAGGKKDRVFAMDVKQAAAGTTIAFSASLASGAGAAPEGKGKGEIRDDGVLTFTFTDSFGNEGAGMLEKHGDHYSLKLDATKVEDPRAVRFYGALTLRKQSGKPQE